MASTRPASTCSARTEAPMHLQSLSWIRGTWSLPRGWNLPWIYQLLSDEDEEAGRAASSPRKGHPEEWPGHRAGPAPITGWAPSPSRTCGSQVTDTGHRVLGSIRKPQPPTWRTSLCSKGISSRLPGDPAQAPEAHSASAPISFHDRLSYFSTVDKGAYQSHLFN